MKPKVLNRRTDNIPPDAVYVGRPSKWGNPFRLVKYGDREYVINRYREYISDQIKYGYLDISELKGKDLVCWCSPLPCHADVLIELANQE